MSINLLETVQQTLNYQPLQKVDPNTQEVKIDNKTPSEERFSQATIPAAIIALYQFSTTKDGAATIIQNNENTDWPEIIFYDRKEEFFEKIASYSYDNVYNCVPRIQEVFVTAVAAIKQHASEGTEEGVKKLLADQRNLVLPYLPAEIQIGTLLNDDSIDDRTHKMEGPMSNLMHAIGNIFSSSDEVKPVK
ncbi:MAG: hypothetical protein V4722_13395 [Bacteroidota bacterium]